MNQALQISSPLASQLKLDAHRMPFSANRNFQRDPRFIVGAEEGAKHIGDTLQFGPTFNAKPQELDRLFDAVGQALQGIN